MRIVIDPTSLRETASVLRSAADVLGELCSLVGSAVNGVYAPPSVASYADSLTSSAASAIHNVIYELLDEAADLERRAACCCADPSTSLPVPALVGLAFGGTAIGTAASGPGIPAPAVTAVAGARAPISIHEALGNTTLGGTAPAATTITGGSPGISIYEALGNTTLGGTSPVGTASPPGAVYETVAGSVLGGTRPGLGISMVPDPSYNLVPARVGMGVSGSSAMGAILAQQQIHRGYTLTGSNTLFQVGFLGMDPYG